MATRKPRKLTPSRQGIRMPQPDAEPELAPRNVDEEPAPGDTNVHIDAKTGYVKTENPDGSVDVRHAGAEPKKPRGKANFDENLAQHIDESVLARITTRLMEGIDADIQSRSEWIATGIRGTELLGVKLEDASSEIGLNGTISQIKHTGMLEACLSMWASSRAELLPVNGPVKVRDDASSDEEGNPSSAPEMMGHNGGPPLDPIASAPPPPPTAPMPGAAPPNTPLPGASPGIAAAPPPGPPPPPPIPPMSSSEKRNKIGEDFQNDFNHYLTVVDKEYYPDFSRMLMSRNLLGCQFRKVYFDPILRRPVSRWVKGANLIVSNEATHLSGAARVTEEIPMRQSMVKRLQHVKHWRKVELVIPTGTPDAMKKAIAESEGIDPMPKLPADQLHTIYECYTELGEYDDAEFSKDGTGKTPGFPLPYRVTIDKDSRKILEIRRNWKMEDTEYQPRQRYVKYGLIPGLGFYDWGFVHLIGNPQRGATMIEQVLIDTGMLNSFPGGVMAKSPGTRQRSTEIRPSPGQFVVMDTGGLPLSDFIMPWPYKEPSATLKEMGVDLAAQMKRIAGVVELPVGEGMTNVPVGTIMAYIEAVSKVPSAVHKDDHIAQQEEYELLRELFAENPDTLWKFARKPKRKWAVTQEIMDQDLVPASDPNVPSQTHRLMQTNLLVQTGGQVQFQGIANQRALWERTVRVLGASNTGEFTLPPAPAAAPPPDPKVVTAQIKAASEQASDQTKLAEVDKKHAAKTEELIMTSADKAADRDAKEKLALINAATAKHTDNVDLIKHGVGIAADHTQHTDVMQHKHLETALDQAQHQDGLAQADKDRDAAATADSAALAQPDNPAQ